MQEKSSGQIIPGALSLSHDDRRKLGGTAAVSRKPLVILCKVSMRNWSETNDRLAGRLRDFQLELAT
jgi:hypothetical protein